MAIARKKNAGRPSNLDRQIKRSVELAPYAAYVPNPEEKASHLKTVLAVEGDTVGTTNTQTLTNKTYLGNGAGITALNGSAVTTGTVAAGQLPALNAITAPAADVAMNSKKITGLADPVADTDASTKQYVDDKYSQTQYTHNQSTSQNPWPITHNLGYYPDVTIMQSVSGGGSDDYEEVEAHVQHNSINDLTINLSGVAAGLALMR
mgnify:CR=1 FL=1